MAVQVVIETAHIFPDIARRSGVIGELKVHPGDAASDFQFVRQIVPNLAVVTPVVTDLVYGFEIIAAVIAGGLNAQALITEATIDGDVGRAVAGHHILKARGLIDRVKGRSNPQGQLRFQGRGRGAFQIAVGIKDVVFQPSLPGDFCAGILLSARIQGPNTVGGQRVVGQPTDFSAQMRADRALQIKGIIRFG